MADDHYSYRVTWSAPDQEFVATCAEFPSLSWLDETQEGALRGVKALVHDTLMEMRDSGDEIPTPIADKDFSGNLLLRIPPDLHRKLAIRAAECRMSLNRLINYHLALVI